MAVAEAEAVVGAESSSITVSAVAALEGALLDWAIASITCVAGLSIDIPSSCDASGSSRDSFKPVRSKSSRIGADGDFEICVGREIDGRSKLDCVLFHWGSPIGLRDDRFVSLVSLTLVESKLAVR